MKNKENKMLKRFLKKKKKITQALVVTFLITGGIFGGNVFAASAKQSPNVVLIYVDDLGWGDIGTAPYNHSVVKTPNLDALSEDGITFSQWYAPAPLCSPSRAGLLTGRTPYRTGVRSWIPHNQDVHLGENEITIAHLLQSQGYDTMISGKLHLNGGAFVESHPQAKDFGFDYSFISPGGWVENKKVETPNADGSPRRGKLYPDNFVRNGKPVGKTNDFSGKLVADEAMNWLDKQGGDSPFFIYLAFSEVHTPIASPRKYLDMYDQYLTDEARDNPDIYHYDWVGRPYRGEGEYYANISYMDAQVGRVVSKLKEMGEYEDTIIIFTSDNGPVTPEFRKEWEVGLAGSTGGLRGRKDNLFEGGIRVPAIVSYPKAVEGGAIYEEPVTALDILPTLAELTGYEVPNDRVIDGTSFTAALEGKPIKRTKPLIWTIDMAGEYDEINEWAIRDGDYKLILSRDEKPVFLFNIANDFQEVKNLIDKEPKVLERMMTLFEEYRKDIESDSLLAKRQK